MPYKILIIDDETSAIEVVVEALNADDYELMVALSGLTGYDIAQKNKPDLIIIDWEMNDLNGIETISLLKRNKLTNDIPIIMATGKRLMSQDLKIALEAGAIDYIRKPFDKVELISRVRSMLLLFETANKNIRLEKQIHEQNLQSLKKDVENKNNELAEKLLQMHSQEDLSFKIRNGLEKIIELSNDRDITEISRGLIVECNSKNTQQVWDEFETVFEQINKGFYSKIQEQYPDISISERKICAYLKLNFTTKEIAAISHKSVDAIKKARHRLRKKINLELDDDLSVFIQSL